VKYAFMSFSCEKLNLDEMLSLAVRYGYDGIEPRIGQGHGHGVELNIAPARRKEIKQKAVDTGIALCCIATSCSYSNPATAKEQVAETHCCIDLAADVGAPRLRVFGGFIPDGVSREQAADLLVESLRSVADHAAERAVTVCMETHDHWCDPAHVREVITRVDHPAIAVNWDIKHPVHVAGVALDRAFEILKPWIRHVHFHDGVESEGAEKLTPIGEGEIDHRRALELLRTIPYDGYLSGEWIEWEPYEVHLPRELATMKRYELRNH